MSITNGTIEFSRRVRTGDFEHKDAKVSFSFTLAEGDDPRGVAERVSSLAVERALSMVGEKLPVTIGNPTTTAAPAAFWLCYACFGLDGARKRPVLDIMGSAEPERNRLLDAQLVAAGVTEPTITDKRLVDELTAKNARMLGQADTDLKRQSVPVSLHKLVAEFVAPQAKVQAIPQEQRADFLAKLAAL